MRFLNRCLILYLLVGLFIIWVVDENKLAAKALDYEDIAPGFLLEFAKNQSGSFWSPRAEQVLRYYRNLVKIYPDSPYAYAALAFSYHYYGNNKKSIRFYKKAISLNPNLFGLYYNLGILYIQEREFEKAEGILSQAVQSSPNETVNYPYTVIPSIHQEKGFNDSEKFINLKESFDKCIELITLLKDSQKQDQIFKDGAVPNKLIYYVPLKPVKSDGKVNFIMI